MSDTYVYSIGDGLYINMTNRCTNNCRFCIRYTDSGIGDYDLWLKKEPSVDEVMAVLKEYNLSDFKEIVFCGYGEPLIRFEDCMEICRKIREISNIQIRINTNGHANIYAGRDVTREMAGLVDIISISLNASNAKDYNEICKCDYGEAGFDAMIDFAKKCTKYVPWVIMSVVDVIDKESIEECKRIAQSIGAEFRVRKYSN